MDAVWFEHSVDDVRDFIFEEGQTSAAEMLRVFGDRTSYRAVYAVAMIVSQLVRNYEEKGLHSIHLEKLKAAYDGIMPVAEWFAGSELALGTGTVEEKTQRLNEAIAFEKLLGDSQE